FEDADGTLWAGGHGVWRRRAGAWQPAAPPGAPWTTADWPLEANIWGFYRQPDGLWLTTEDGFYRVADPSQGESPRADPGPLSPPPPGYAHLPPVILRKNVARCPDGSLWLARNADIFRDGRPVASLGSTVNSLLCDREGSLWVTTAHDGLHRFRRSLLRTYGEPEGLGFRSVYHIYQDRAGALWFAGDGGRVSRLRDGAFEYLTAGAYAAEGDDPEWNADQAIYEDRAGTLWMGFRVCPAPQRAADGGCARFTWAEGAPRRHDVYAIRQTGDGALWFGTLSGLYRLAAGRWTLFTTGKGLPDDHVRYLLEARDGTLYAATLRGGVVRFEGGRFTAITTADGLSSDHVRALYEDARGVLWIGTEDGGLNRLDPETGRVAIVRQTDGLYADGVHQIVEDGLGRLWMSTNKGLFWVGRAELDAFARGDVRRVQSVAYTERDGMRSREANGGRQESALRASDGRLWFATQDGAVVVDPADVVGGEAPPPVVIEQVTAGAASAPVRPGARVALSADQRSFRIDYTAPTFVAPERVRFRYRLDGFDRDWVEAEHRREAVYTRVPPGAYTFRVAASTGDGVWTEDDAVLAVSVAPFAHETGWFLALCGLAAAALLAAGYRARTRHLFRRQRELEALVDGRTRALQAETKKTEAQARRLEELDRLKSRFFTNVSHEFRTPLTLTIGPLEDLRSGEHGPLPAWAREKADLALRNSRRLLRLIGQLLDVAKVEAGEMRLRAREDDLTLFLRGVALSFAPLAERRRVTLDVETPEAPVPVYFDADRLEQTLANLLSNALKFTPEGGTVRVSLGVDGRSAVVRVQDSGRGVPAEALPHLFERFYQADGAPALLQAGSGVGLSLARDLAELHGGTVTAESAAGSGATFTVTLPLGRAHLSDDQIVPRSTEPDTRPAPAAPSSGYGSGLLIPEVFIPYETGSLGGDDAPEDDDRTTVLIADDNAELRAYVRGHLEGRYRVLEAADGVDALETARTALPDLVVSDVMMPGLDGVALVAALRADRRTDFIPVVLLTARAADEDRMEGLEGGADDYLTKPFSVRELKVRVDNLIASRRMLRERFAADPPARTPTPSPPRDGLSASDAAFLDAVRAAIDAGLGDEEFGVEELAAAVGQSRSTLHRRLRQLLDESPTDFLRQSRLERAAVLLRERRGTVSEVAYAVGFRSVSHFSQAFRASFGVSPSAFVDHVAEPAPA
ncbi:MAG TPA: two-component regulator propeller domain-containing protein, partial [Rubricoccaceae bacterium]